MAALLDASTVSAQNLAGHFKPHQRASQAPMPDLGFRIGRTVENISVQTPWKGSH